jgi:hypothetical protein
MDIPSLDLPKALRTMLESLACQNEVRNWSIYPESNGNVCVKIRFTELSSEMPMKPTTFKRKSRNQYNRDSARCGRSQNNGAVTRSKSAIIKSGNNDNSVEQPRSADVEHSAIMSPLLPETSLSRSPVDINCFSPVIQSPTMHIKTNKETDPLLDNSQMDTLTNMTNKPPQQHGQGLNNNNKVDNDTDSDLDMDTIDEEPQPPCSECFRTTIPLASKCMKCEYNFCKNCTRLKVPGTCHRKHASFMVSI